MSDGFFSFLSWCFGVVGGAVIGAMAYSSVQTRILEDCRTMGVTRINDQVVICHFKDTK